MKISKHYHALVAAALAVPLTAFAASPDRDWPSVEVAPILDVPMRDTAITRGPDGVYYLTGTLGAPQSHPSHTSHSVDFENTHVIKLWKSTDLKTWEEIGVVWDIGHHKNARGWNWQNYWRVPLEAEYRPPVRGVVAPELHHVRGAWYICFSINGQGTGLIRSTSGKPEGPYEEVAQITTKGNHPSMFEDDDPADGGAGGKVYWLFDGGWIARMTDDLTALAERPRLLMPAHDPRFGMHKAHASPESGFKWADDPRQVGKRGAFLFKRRGRYYLCAADYNSRLGRPCNDTFIAYADHIYGPYSERHLMIPHGGGITVFPGPKTTAIDPEHTGPYDSKEKTHVADQQLYASFYGADERAILRDRPAILPLEWTGPKRWDVYFFKHHESFPRKPQNVFTECGPWSRMKPLPFKEGMRDISIRRGPDGWFYLTCSGRGRSGELVIYRSQDLQDWKEFKVIWRYEDIEWLTQKIPEPRDDSRQANRARFLRVFWDVGMTYTREKCEVEFNMYPADDIGVPGHGGRGRLRSTTGRPEGPYESLGRIAGHYADSGDSAKPEPFMAYDGRKYVQAKIDWQMKVALAEPEEVKDWKKDWDWKLLDLGPGVVFASDGWARLRLLEGHYVAMGTRWGGPVFNPHTEGGGKHRGTYDFSYAVGPTPFGPFGRPKPMARNGGLFQDEFGAWWMIFFGNDGSGPWWQKPGLAPIDMSRTPDDLTIDVKMPPYNRRELRIMGGGEVAEVKTVPETLVADENK